MQVQYFSYRKKFVSINFDFCKTVSKNICDAHFKTYKISNSVVNSIIYFRAKQY